MLLSQVTRVGGMSLLQEWVVCYCYKCGHYATVTRVGGLLLLQKRLVRYCYKSGHYVTVTRVGGIVTGTLQE